VNLNSIEFETFGWNLVVDEESVRGWQQENASLAIRYFDVPPDFDAWDAESIRLDMLEYQGYLESPSFDARNFELPDELSYIDPSMLPSQMSPLEVDCFLIEGAKCVFVLTRHRASDTVGYTAMIFILFDVCFWLLAIEMDERDYVGKREGAVARIVLDSIEPDDVSGATFDPYDRTWDGLLLIENDPLTQIRSLADALRESIRLSESIVQLAPFNPEAD
jgi:hypothetical protein